MFRKTLIWLAVGFAIGTFASMWFGPEIVTWWVTPPGGPSALSCEPQTRWATTIMVRFQLIAGGSLGLLLAILINVLSRRGAKSATGSTPVPPPAVPR